MFRSSTLFKGFSKPVLLTGVLLGAVVLNGCDLATNTLQSDREGGMEMQDYRDGLASRLPGPLEDEDMKNNNIPELQPYVAQSTERMKPMPLVSISVNQSVPIRDALYELAQQADYDVELDPNIRGSVIFTARERPFDEVVARISKIAGLRYKFDNDVLRIEQDTPYNKIYKIDYLSYVRANKSNVRNNIAVVTGDGADTGSAFEMASKSEADFWGELENNLDQIVRGSQTGALKTRRDPRISAAEQNPNVQTVAPQTTGPNGEVIVQPQAPQATLNVEALPLDDEETTSGGSSEADPNEGTFTINRQAGLINVYASERSHEQVQEYLSVMKKAVTAQVLIEAKVLEVDLNDEYATGVDWTGIAGEFAIDFDSTSPTLNVAENIPFSAVYNGNDFGALVQAVAGFGTVRALASPRLTVLNNQSALLNVATNRVYFDLDIDVTGATDGSPPQTDISSDIKNVPEGVLVNVQPSINLEDGTISMAVRPSITRIVNFQPDPAVTYITAANGIDGVANLVPELNVQEIDSVIQTRSGQAVIMGGLLQDRIVVNDEGIPVASEVPLVGNLFKSHNNTVQKTELIIFLKATILKNPSDSVHSTDKDLYRQFSSDRRPLRF